MPIINWNQQPPTFPHIPTGSIIQTNSKLGHELIAGPLVGNRQIVGHKEPGTGAYAEYIDSALQRYQFIRVIPPISDEHGLASWQRMEQQFGEPWAVLDNCQHGARKAYYGVPNSPAVNGFAMVGGVALLLWAANR